MGSGKEAKHVLLCWEFGQGATHARILKTIGDRLADQGCKVTYVFCVPSAGEEAGIAPEQIRPGPGWPLKTAPGFGGRTLTSASYGDIFAQMFLDVEGELDERLRRWRRIIDEERPHLIIGDYAPGLSLAIHGSVPLISSGNGYTLPPVHLPAFPIIGRQPAKYREEEAVDRINRILGAHRLKRIEKLPEINRADHHCLLTYPLFDPYRVQRRDPWLGSPIIPEISRSDRTGSALLAYFYEKRQLDQRLLDGLVGGGLSGNAVFSTPIRQTAKKLAKAQIETPFGLLDLTEELPKTRLLVHQGGLNLSATGALYGIAQVIVYTDQEKKLYAEALAECGAGFMLEWSGFTAGELAAAIREAARDATVMNAARRLAEDITPYAKLDTLAEIMKAALKFLSST